MRSEEARALAHRIIDTWPAFVIKAHVWCDGLIDLDHDEALAVYEYLRDHDERAPSVARFRAMYRNARLDYGWSGTDPASDPPISLDEYLRRHPDDVHLQAARSGSDG